MTMHNQTSYGGPTEAIALRRAEAELDRCLQILMALFPDPEFKQTSPRVRLERYAPLPEQCFRPAGHLVTLYTRTDLRRPVEEVLTVLLHKAVHLANAFRWTEDCNWRSRHNRRFRELAKQVGFDVTWENSRYGWARTTPSARLLLMMRRLRFDQQVLEPFHGSGATTSPMTWHCGQFCFPEPEEIRALLRRPPPAPHRMRMLEVHGRTIRRDDQSCRPMLKVTGRWLTQFGFPQGSRIRVEARYGELKIKARDVSLRDEDQL
jgi:hypothetical protein